MTSLLKPCYQIDSQGYIQFPIIGRYSCWKIINPSQSRITQPAVPLFKTPDVIVRVLSYQGQRYPFRAMSWKADSFISAISRSVYTALGMAGGVNAEQGNNASMTLVRQGRTYTLNTVELKKAGFSLHNLLIQPNDTLYVNNRENQKIYVMGESGNNQSLPLRDQGMSLSDVLGESLGLNPLRQP